MRRKSLMQREPSGKLKRVSVQRENTSAAEAQRLRTAALAGMRDAVWGTTLGWLYLNGKLTAAQFATGRRWSDLGEQYHIAMRSPRAPSSAGLERSASNSIDPDTFDGRKEARRHAQIADEFTSAAAILAHAGSASVRAVADVCDRDQMPVGEDGLRGLASGLQALAAFWGGNGRKRA